MCGDFGRKCLVHYIICCIVLVVFPLIQFIYRSYASATSSKTLFETTGVICDYLLTTTYVFTIISILKVLKNSHRDDRRIRGESTEGAEIDLEPSVNETNIHDNTTDKNPSLESSKHDQIRIHGHSLLPKVLLFILGCGDALFNVTRFGDQFFMIIYSDYENDHCKYRMNVSITENFFRSLSQLSILFFMLSDEKKEPRSPFLRAFIHVLPASMFCQWMMIIMQEVDSHMRHDDICIKQNWNTIYSYNNTEDYLYPLGTEFRSFAFMELVIIAVTIGGGYQHKVTTTRILLESDKSQRSHSDSYVPCIRAIVGIIGVLIVIFSIAFILFQEKYYEDEKNNIILISEISEVVLVVILLLLTIGSFVAGNKRQNIIDSEWDRRKVIELIALGLAWLILVVYSSLTVYGACKYDTNNRIEIHTRKLTMAASILSLIQSSLQFVLIFRATRRKRYFSASMSKVWIIGSFAMWLFDSFSAKKYSTNVIQLKAYGHTEWIYLGAIFIPLSIFFRFHSCVVLAHMN